MADPANRIAQEISIYGELAAGTNLAPPLQIFRLLSIPFWVVLPHHHLHRHCYLDLTNKNIEEEGGGRCSCWVQLGDSQKLSKCLRLNYYI